MASTGFASTVSAARAPLAPGAATAQTTNAAPPDTHASVAASATSTHLATSCAFKVAVLLLGGLEARPKHQQAAARQPQLQGMGRLQLVALASWIGLPTRW
jgi:hypothetical protein